MLKYMKQDQLRPHIVALTDAVIALTDALVVLNSRDRATAKAASDKPSTDTKTPTGTTALLTIAEFLQEVHISYSTYRKLRLQGKAPAELRLSARVIRLSRPAVDEWRQRNERVVARINGVRSTTWPFGFVSFDPSGNA